MINIFRAWTAACGISLALTACSPSDLVPGVNNNGIRVTKAQFDRIKIGMSYDEVKAIVGGDCNVTLEGGEAGSPSRLVMYSCDGRGALGANMNFMLQGGKVSNKGQFGLQ